MKPTDDTTKMPIAAFGFFATLCGLLRTNGSGVSKIGRGAGAPPARRLVLAALATTLGALVFSGAPALAAAPETPQVNVYNIGATHASLRGVLNPGAPGEPGAYEVLYRQSSTECKGGSSSGGLSLGGQEEEVLETLTGLQPGKKYTVCVSASNGNSPPETSVSSPVTFETLILPETPETRPASPVAATTATLRGVLNPKAAGSPGIYDYEFLYKQSASECEGGAASGGSASNGMQAAVKAEVTGLLPDTTNTFCLRATNAAGEGPVGPAVTFRTPPETYVTEVTSSSATLHAVVDPEGGSTSYRFQYVSEAQLEESGFTSATSTQQASVEGASAVNVEAHIQGLAAGSVYHFRVIASNAATEAFASEDHNLTTHPSGSEFSLPDGRQYQMVSPPDKYGGSIGPMNEFGRVIQASEDGSKLTFTATDPITADPAGNRGGLEPSQVLASRGPAGWADEEITTPNNDVGVLRLGHEAEYEFFSSDLSLGVVQPPGETPLAPPVLPGETQERTLWLRDNSTASYSALASAANAESKLGGTEAEEAGNPENYPYFEGASPDLRHIVFHDPNPLAEGEGGGLYESSSGTLQRVSVLPANGGNVNASILPGGQGRTANAVSDNGSRVIWAYEDHLYLRDMQLKETVQLDEPEPGCNTCHTERAPEFMTASADGSKVFFVDESPLTEGSSASSGESMADLYVFEETEASHDGGPLAGKLTDLTLDPNFDAAKDEGERAAVQETIGASENGSYVYFVAAGLLGDAKERGATPGDCGQSRATYQEEEEETCNLYVAHLANSGWEEPQFIATLSGSDHPDWTATGGLKHLTARVSPDGRWLAFMSDRPLTGYDNTDVSDAETSINPKERNVKATVHHDEEVYLFDEASGGLVCASCNPSGERPEGVFDPVEEEPGYHKLLVDEPASWEGRWLAGSVPGWTTYHVFQALYQSRYLSNNGRLFFNSPDALVPADVDHQENVYEFEPQGVGGCTPATVDASEVYEPATGGCVGLISSGTSTQESAFLDASVTGGRDSEADEGGGDVFFLTSSQLAPQDVDQAYDIYDAHECSAGSPCVLQAAAAVPPACSNEASCKAAPETQPSIYGLPSSATFTGESNFAPAPPPPPVKTVTKKPVKCKKAGNGSRRREKSRCVKKPKKKDKARKSAHANRRASR
jgi:hypothetical protein